jgi:hypothetical protein
MSQYVAIYPLAVNVASRPRSSPFAGSSDALQRVVNEIDKIINPPTDNVVSLPHSQNRPRCTDDEAGVVVLVDRPRGRKRRAAGMAAI